MDIELIKKGMEVQTEVNATQSYLDMFVEHIKKGDVVLAIDMLEDCGTRAAENLLKYETASHKVMKRPDKAIYDKKGNFLRYKKLNKVSIPYQKYINEIALVFIYGRPVKWSDNSKFPYEEEERQLKEELETIIATQEESEETTTAINDAQAQERIKSRLRFIEEERKKFDTRFDKFIDTLNDCHFNALIREAKIVAGSEGTSAMLFHTYQENGEAKMLAKVLSKKKNDDIYTMFDQYDRLKAFAWGYSTSDRKNNTILHYDIYTANEIYYCARRNGSDWSVETHKNVIGKIPVIVFQQEVEWEGVDNMIDRIESSYSKTADANDNFGDPALVATADIVNTLPVQEEESKLYVLKNGGDIKYLERSGNIQSRQDEARSLDEQILSKTFTPNVTLDQLKGLANVSGEALSKVFLLANIKAARRKDSHDGYLSRVSNLVLSIMENVTAKGDNAHYSDMDILHEFQEPFGSDISNTLSDLIKQYGADALSLQTVLESSYLVRDAGEEMRRIRIEQKERDERAQANVQQDIFE